MQLTRVFFLKGDWGEVGEGCFKSLNSKLTVYCHLPLQQMLRKGWTYWEGKGHAAHLVTLAQKVNNSKISKNHFFA